MNHECPDCEGYGLIDPETLRGASEGTTCETCHGYGYVIVKGEQLFLKK